MKKLAVFIFITLLAACSVSKKVYEVSSLDPESIDAEKFSRSVAVIFSPNLKEFIQTGYPAITSAHHFELKVGKCLCYYLTKAVNAAYQKVTRVEEEPVLDKYERIIKFSLKGSRYITSPSAEVDLSEKQIVPQSQQVTYIISVKMEAYDSKTRHLISKKVVEGNSLFSRGGGETAEYEKLKEAIRTAVRQASYNIARCLLSGCAESKRPPLT